ncbi:MAG: DsbA family protein, partial [Rhodospirillaceae bacterium]|nr:DsbA family protein [Rhodospirillaceae bacterium]
MPKEITVDIVSDTVCPWCYIGKRRFEQALAQRPADLDIHVSWRPFQLNPDIPAEGKDRRVYLAAKFGGDEQAKKIYQTIRDAGNLVELDFDFEAMDRQPNTINSHRLIDRARQLWMQDVIVVR